MDSNKAYATIQMLAQQVKLGLMTYDEGKKRSEPYIEICNAKIAEIAKKHGKKPYRITWLGVSH